MSLNADDLKINTTISDIIERKTKEILSVIDDEIKKAHNYGKHSVIVKLPSIIDIPNLNNSDSQREIYFRVLTSLLERKFAPTLIIKNNINAVLIKWMSKKEAEEIKTKLEFIASYTQKINTDDN